MAGSNHYCTGSSWFELCCWQKWELLSSWNWDGCSLSLNFCSIFDQITWKKQLFL